MGSNKKPKAPTYSSTTSINPYAVGVVDENGSAGYQLNDFLSKMNTKVENVLPSLYDQLLNPNLDNTVSRARINAFTTELNEQTQRQFENSVSALSDKGLLRSSVMNDMVNNLSQNQSSQIANYINTLLAENMSDTTGLINTFLNQYSLGARYGESALADAITANELYNNYNLSKYKIGMDSNKSNNGLASSVSSLLGAVIGGYLSGGAGASAGSAIGKVIGQKIEGGF